MRQKYKEPPIQKRQLQNPYQKSNPYRVKAKLDSVQTKENRRKLCQSTGTSSNQNHNPQSLYYRRSYKQTPPLVKRDNFVSLTNYSSPYQKYRPASQHIDYKIKLRSHIVDKFCAADPYLEVVKDKFAYFSVDRNSQFSNVMRMSNLSKGKHTSGNGKGSYSRVPKDNPFFRKNLIALPSEKFVQDQKYSQFVYAISNYVPVAYSQANFLDNQPLNDSYIGKSQYNYQKDRQSPRQSSTFHRRQSGFIDASGYHGDVYQADSYQVKSQVGNHSPKSIQSFGNERKQKKRLYSYVDTVIERALDDQDGIQARAPQQITVGGKVFFLNAVTRASG